MLIWDNEHDMISKKIQKSHFWLEILQMILPPIIDLRMHRMHGWRADFSKFSGGGPPTQSSHPQCSCSVLSAPHWFHLIWSQEGGAHQNQKLWIFMTQSTPAYQQAAVGFTITIPTTGPTTYQLNLPRKNIGTQGNGWNLLTIFANIAGERRHDWAARTHTTDLTPSH